MYLSGQHEERALTLKKIELPIDIEYIVKECEYYSRLHTNGYNASDLEEERDYLQMISLLGVDDNSLKIQNEFLVEFYDKHYKFDTAKGAEEFNLVMNEKLMFIRSLREEPKIPTFDGLLMRKKIGFDNKYILDDEVSSPLELKSSNFVPSFFTGFRTGSKIEYRQLVDYFYGKTEYLSLTDGSGVWTFNDTHWGELTPLEVKGFCEDHVDPEPKEAERREYYNKVLINHLQDRSFFEDTNGVFNLKNGVYNMDDGKLHPHDRKYGFRYVLDYEYDAEAKCPLFEKFLDEITCNREELRNIILEYIGYALSGVLNEVGQKSLILLGEGSNGKSTFVNVMKSIFGLKNVCEATMTSLQKPEMRYHLEGKLLNIGDETQGDSLEHSDIFKLLSSGGTIDVRKLYSQPYTMQAKTKLVLLCNRLPRSTDRSYAFYRRMLIVPFEATFSEEKGNIDRFIGTKLEKELPGIFNLLIKHFRELKDRGFSFTESNITKNLLREYEVENDNIKAWLDDNITMYSATDPDYSDHSETKEDLFVDYKRYCKLYVSKTAGRELFFKRLKTVMHNNYREERRTVALKRKRMLIGIQILDSEKYLRF